VSVDTQRATRARSVGRRRVNGNRDKRKPRSWVSPRLIVRILCKRKGRFRGEFRARFHRERAVGFSAFRGQSVVETV